MTENPPYPHRIARCHRGFSLVALAALTLAGCSSPTSPNAGSTAPSALPQATVTVTAPPPPETVTVTPSPAPAPAGRFTGTGAFQSPSGNIHCAMSSFDGQTRVQCESVNHAWSVPPPAPQCHLNWGSRLELRQGGAAGFACYGQELPVPDRTLGYGATWSIGAITCASESAGITCTDGGAGHQFFMSRDTYRLG